MWLQQTFSNPHGAAEEAPFLMVPSQKIVQKVLSV
jgi:hypothetical protein